MLENTSEAVVNILLKKQIIKPEKQNIYKEGFKLFMADLINIFLVIIIGLITKSFIHSALYLFMLLTVRRFCGGFHAKTYYLCRTITVGTYILIFTASCLIVRYQLTMSIIINAVAVTTMLLFSPVVVPGKELTFKEKRINKILSVITTTIFSVISMALCIAGKKTGFVISLILMAIVILMYIGMAAYRRKEEK